MVQRGFEELSAGGLLKKLVVVLLLAANLSLAQLLDRVVANVNGEPILESELKVAQMFYGVKDRDKLIELLIQKHLIAQFLRDNGLKVPEGYVDTLIEDIARSNGKSVDELYRELYSKGLSPADLRSFLEVEVASTLGLREYLMSRVEVSDIEIEIERLRTGDVEYVREIELLAVGKEKKEELLKLIGKYGTDLDKVAAELGEKLERLKVKKGELVESLEEELWKVKRGDIAVAEDEENLYIAKVLRELRVISGRNEDEIKEELISRKLKEKEKELIEKLKKGSLVEVYG